MRILKSLDLNRDQELYRKNSNQNLNQSLNICKRSYTKGSVDNQKAQKSVLVLDGNLRVKNAPKHSIRYLVDKICKIKQTENIPVTLTTFLKTF